ncbi:hypothetical protein ACFYL6_20990 [Micromonospora sp. NPDC007208]|uniref:hypothetical protein n=1 Tax=Micromonospora sp. NPDC007208 TaxID=3364236 RepID=UPI00367C73A6
MCAINGKCGCNRVAGGFWEFILVGGAQLVWWLLKKLAQAVQLLLVALILTTKWAAPRAYRLSRRGAKAVHRWYVTRPVLLEREQPAAVTATTTAPTLADLRLTRKEANVR